MRSNEFKLKKNNLNKKLHQQNKIKKSNKTPMIIIAIFLETRRQISKHGYFNGNFKVQKMSPYHLKK